MHSEAANEAADQMHKTVKANFGIDISVMEPARRARRYYLLADKVLPGFQRLFGE